MVEKVVINLAKKYENVKEGVKSVMGGQVLEYDAKTILNQGIEQANIISAQKMLLGNMEVSLIVQFTSLEKETVEKLKEEMIQNGQLEEETEGDK